MGSIHEKKVKVENLMTLPLYVKTICCHLKSRDIILIICRPQEQQMFLN